MVGLKKMICSEMDRSEEHLLWPLSHTRATKHLMAKKKTTNNDSVSQEKSRRDYSNFDAWATAMAGNFFGKICSDDPTKWNHPTLQKKEKQQQSLSIWPVEKFLSDTKSGHLFDTEHTSKTHHPSTQEVCQCQLTGVYWCSYHSHLAMTKVYCFRCRCWRESRRWDQLIHPHMW